MSRRISSDDGAEESHRLVDNDASDGNGINLAISGIDNKE